jgi:arylsulfatase A-like enzyme
LRATAALFSLLVAVAVAVAGCERYVPAQPTNLLLVTIDTLRADALGSYGQRLPTSPHIDRLARQGAVFERCVSSSPNTLPSHATLMTSLQPYTHGVRSNSGYLLHPDHVTLAEILRGHGYRTAAEVSAPVLKAQTRLDQGFDHYRGTDSPGAELKKFRITHGSEETIATELTRPAHVVSRQAVRFLRANPDRKFFLWLHYFDPHQPYSPPEAFRSRMPDDPYHAEIAFADSQVGIVLQELERLGLDDNTLVVLTSDHGEGLDEHGEETHSFFVYDSTMHVPLILRGPGISGDQRIASVVRLLDVVPTVVDLLGFDPPEAMQGTSLRPLLEGSETELGLQAYGESIELAAVFGAPILRFLREGRWKYIHKVEPELYDLDADPGERHDLSAGEPERVAELAERLRNLIRAAPAAPADATVSVDRATREQLASLGYAAADASDGLADEVAALELTGPDAAALVRDVQLFTSARGEIAGAFTPVEVADKLRALHERFPQSRVILEQFTDSLLRLETGEYEPGPLLVAAAQIDPENSRLFVKLATLARRSGEEEEAIAALRRALAAEPCNEAPTATLALLLGWQQRYREKLDVLRRGAEHCPSSLGVRNDYAWALSTMPDSSLRDGAAAVEVARAVVADADRPNPEHLDTLAAASAEAGNYSEAVRITKETLASLEGQPGADGLREALQGHLREFEAGRPIREN